MGEIGVVERALWFTAPGAVDVRPVELPTLAADEVRVATRCSGISAGTELLAFRGHLPADLAIDESIGALGGSFDYPFRYGYSSVGEVEAVGDQVDDVSIGDQVFAFHPHQTRFDAAPADLVPIDGLDPRAAVLLPYVETALQVTLDCGAVFGETVAVSGLGVLGTLVSLLLQRAGADVVAAEPQPWRRDIAARVGIRAVEPDDVAEVIDDKVPLAVECSGNAAALAPLLDLVSHEGTVLVASWYGTNPVTLPLGGSFHRRRLTIRSSQVSTIPAAASGRWTHRRRILHARDLAADLPLAELATHVVPFESPADGYRLLDAGAPGVMHVAFGYR